MAMAMDVRGGAGVMIHHPDLVNLDRRSNARRARGVGRERGGVTIGAGALIDAGALVTRDVRDGVTVAGVPAQLLARGRKDRL